MHDTIPCFAYLKFKEAIPTVKCLLSKLKKYHMLSNMHFSLSVSLTLGIDNICQISYLMHLFDFGQLPKIYPSILGKKHHIRSETLSAHVYANVEHFSGSVVSGSFGNIRKAINCIKVVSTFYNRVQVIMLHHQ